MILINLLPPELRKKRGGGGSSNPLLLPIAAVWILPLAAAGLWLYLDYVRLPQSVQILADKTAELADKTALAKTVTDKKEKIAAAQAQLDTIENLVGQKLYWAPVLDDFATHLTTSWTDFEISCTSFSIQPASAAQPGSNKKEAPQSVLRGTYRLLGKDFTKSGDYIRSFFAQTQVSPFWMNHGFVGRSEASYNGDTPRWIAEIERAGIELNIDWTRSKPVASDKKREAR
jgi:hypothetical protein